MQKKRMISLCLVFLYIFFCGCNQIEKKSTGVNAVPESPVESVYMESTAEEEDTEKQSTTKNEETTINIEEKRIEAFNVVAGKLTAVRDMLQATGSDKSVTDFVEWFTAEYGEDVLFQIFEQAGQGRYSDKLFYMLTGSSVYVLTDAFLGNQEQPGNIKKEAANSEYVNLMFAGDLCLAEDGFVLDYFDETGILSDYVSPVLLEKTNQADIFLINHEYAASTRGEPLNGKYYTFRAKPERVSILEEMGTDIVSLANNHIYDYGAEAFLDTLDILKGAGISYVGGGSNYEEAAKPVFFTINGMKIGYVAASRAEKMRFTPEATETTPGIVRMYDLTNIKNIISQASVQCDYLIVYLHWGTEDSKYFEQYQRETARELFDCGADIIIGGHPHVLQGMEYLEGKPVVYSLGDFWFNGETKYTGLLNLQVSIDGLRQMQFIPCIQTGYKTLYLEQEEEQRKLFDYLQNLSENITIDRAGIISNKE